MFRYLALIWNVHDEAARTHAEQLRLRVSERLHSWLCACEAPGLLLFQPIMDGSSFRTIALSRGQGAIAGNLFHRDDGCEAARPVTRLGEEESARISAQGCSRILECYWGRYIALLRDEADDSVRLLRDPSGTLPCNIVAWQGLQVVFADVEDCMSVTDLSMSINWETLADSVCHRQPFSSRSALKGVTEVHPGEEICFSRGKMQGRLAWNPLRIALQDPIEDFELAVARLGDVVRTCVNSWASQYRGIVVRLSGGLDSSILLSTLANAPTRPALTCLHYYAAGAGEDERRYARITAEHVGANLVEKDLDGSPVKLERILQAKRTLQVGSLLYDVEHRRYESELASGPAAEQGRCSALFSGAGGDGLFYQARADLAMIDFLLRHGFQVQTVAVARQAARMSRKSVCSILFNAMCERAWGSARRALVDSAGATHPWLQDVDARQVSPGKLWHALSGVVAPAGISAFAHTGDPEETLPFLSQPLLELCLRIPTFLSIRGGMDRAVIRQAFAGALPPTILNRTQKGRVHRHLRNTFEHNLDFIRSLLLDGIMLREGLLTRDQLQPVLQVRPAVDDTQFLEVLTRYVPIEAWLRSWCSPASMSV